MKKIFLLVLLSIFSALFCGCGQENPCAQGHTWLDATCTEASKCSICGLANGEPLGHSFGEPTVIKQPSCAEVGIKHYSCSVCSHTKEEDIPTKAHTPGEWTITSQATATSKGTKVQKCSVCGAVIKEEYFEKSLAEIKADYKAICASYTYKEISRNPDNYKGKYAHLKGEIIQSMEDGNSYTFRVNITKSKYYWTDTILVTYTKKSASEDRLLEDDIVDIYGILGGTYTYETVMGNEMTVPIIYAEYVELTN